MSHAQERRAQARRTGESLAEGTGEAVTRGGREAGESNDALVRAHVLGLRAASTLACVAGCSHCCHMEVSASYPEIAHLAEFIEQTFTSAAREAFDRRLDAQCVTLHGKTPFERLTSSTACALLVDGQCSAYEARPLACRGWNSADVAPCLVALEMPGAVPSVPVHRMIRDTSSALAAGVRDGARDAGLDDAPLDLPHALRATLRGGSAVTTRWLAGEMLPAVMKSKPAPERVQGADLLWRPEESLLSAAARPVEVVENAGACPTSPRAHASDAAGPQPPPERNQ